MFSRYFVIDGVLVRIYKCGNNTYRCIVGDVSFSGTKLNDLYYKAIKEIEK